MTNHLQDDWGDDGGLGPTLDAYAEARLRADPARVGAVRAGLVAEARRQARLGAAGGPAAPERPGAPAPRRRWLLLPRPARGPVLAAAGLLLAAALAGGVLAGTAPGGPLYGARLWFEEQLLPAAPGARATAELDRLGDRLDEALAAAGRSDTNAVVAALEAYRRAADEALAAAGDDAARREHVAAQLARHLAVLEALQAQLPDRAAEAVRDALERTEDRIDEILQRPGGPATPAGPAVTPKPRPSTEATPRPNTEARPTPKPKPVPGTEAKPTPKPKPVPGTEAKPTPKPKPVRSPSGRPATPAP